MTDTLTAPTRVEQDCPVPECRWDTRGFVDPPSAYRGHLAGDHKPTDLMATIAALQIALAEANNRADHVHTSTCTVIALMLAERARMRETYTPEQRQAYVEIGHLIADLAEESPNPVKESA